MVINLIATVLKFGDRTQIGAVHLATSLVADLQLIAAAMFWAFAAHISSAGMTGEATAGIVSLSGGALFANIVSVVLLVIETVSFQREVSGVGNPLRAFWRLAAAGRRTLPHRMRWWVPAQSAAQASATIFLVLRRMRSPLITVIVIFAISTLGLTLIPGQDADGNPHRVSFLHAFYVVSYTATTIGFGELPDPFTEAQRLWVTIIIYLSVFGWAYTIGSLLTLLQDRSFRQALGPCSTSPARWPGCGSRSC